MNKHCACLQEPSSSEKVIYCEPKVGTIRARRSSICRFWRPGAAEDMVPHLGSKDEDEEVARGRLRVGEGLCSR